MNSVKKKNCCIIIVWCFRIYSMLVICCNIITYELEFNYKMKAIFQDALGKIKANPEPKIKDPVLSNPNELPENNLDIALDDLMAMKNKKSSFKREENAHPYKLINLQKGPYKSVLTEQKKNSLKEKFGSRLHMKDEINTAQEGAGTQKKEESQWVHDKVQDASQSDEQYMLFIRNLPANSTIIDVKNLFDKYGLIKGIKV